MDCHARQPRREGPRPMKDAVIVGGGLAGAAVATQLARAGRDVVLIERTAGPTDKVCGEFFSREAETYLSAIGLSLKALGAVPISALRLCARGRVAGAPLPFEAWSLSRRIVDEALVQLAAGAGADVRRGVKVSALEPTSEGFRARLADGTAVDAGAAFLATGKHDLQGFERQSGLQNDLLAFKIHYRLSPDQTADLSRHIEILLFEGGYAGLSPVEEGRANLCLVVRRGRFTEVGQRWERLLDAICAESSHLAGRLASAAPCWAKPLALSVIPYGYLRFRSKGLWYLGDQAAVIPSFSGDGMSMALHSARLAAAIYLAGARAELFQRRLAGDVLGQMLLATGLSQALVRRPGQILIGAATRLLPSLMSVVASQTRIPSAALARALPKELTSRSGAPAPSTFVAEPQARSA